VITTNFKVYKGSGGYAKTFPDCCRDDDLAFGEGADGKHEELHFV
jgi:hypothetical protein